MVKHLISNGEVEDDAQGLMILSYAAHNRGGFFNMRDCIQQALCGCNHGS